MPTNKKFYERLYISSNEIQTAYQDDVVSIDTIGVDEAQVVTGEIFDIDKIILPEGRKHIYFHKNIFSNMNLTYFMHNIEFKKTYSIHEFFDKTGIMINMVYENKKMLNDNIYIQINNPLDMVIKFDHSETDNTKYGIIIMYELSEYERVPSPTVTTVLYEYVDRTDEMKNNVLFVNGKLMYIAPVEVDSELSKITLWVSPSNIVERYKLKNIVLNDRLLSLTFDGKTVVEIPAHIHSHLSKRSIMYSNVTLSGLFETNPNIIANRFLEVTDAVPHHVVAVNSPGKEIFDDSISKFERHIGGLVANESDIPASFLITDHSLPDPNTLADDTAIDDAIKLALKYSPDFYKKYLEDKHALDISELDITKYPSRLDNSIEEPDNLVTFSEECVLFKFPAGYGTAILFSDGLALKPEYVYEFSGTENVYFKKSELVAGKVTVTFTKKYFRQGRGYEINVDASKVVTLPPNPKFGTEWTQFMIVEEDYSTYTYTKITDYTITFEEGIVKFNFGADTHIGKTYRVYHTDVGYHKYYKDQDYMSFKLPWYLQYSQGDLFVFAEGRMVDYYVLEPPITQKFFNDPYISLNYESDIVNKDDVYIVADPNLELYESKDTLVATDGLYELTKKEYPFSKKYMVVFVNGKFVDPEDIIEISSYKFGLKNITSIHKLRIYRVCFNDPYIELFKATDVEWDEFIDTKSYAYLKDKFGFAEITDVEPEHISDTDPNFHLYEKLYKYVLMDDITEVTPEVVADLLHDFSDILTPDGRILLECDREPTKAPRYFI